MIKLFQVMGPPGSGKGTQAKLLQEKFGLEYVGSGDLLRARAKIKDFTGRKISKVTSRGERLATPVIFKIWMDKLESFKRKKSRFNGFILDGSPRTLFEAQMLDWALEWYEWKAARRVFFVDISPQEAIDRLTKRRICTRCGKIIPYIGEMRKLKVCDRCGGSLVRRHDDTPGDIRRRLKWFKTDVLPAINYYKRKKELVRINGKQPINKVFEDILSSIKR